jgi:Ca2+-binding RTX toxin-like protein
VALVGGAAGLVAVAAAAVPTCSFDAATGAMTIVVGTGETAVIARSGDAITLDGDPCGAATVTTTDTIAVDGSAGGVNVTIELSGGPFEPGRTPDPEGTSEIEIDLTVPGPSKVLIAGGAKGDHIVLGTDGANLNAAETPGDADVLMTGTPAVTIQGRAGADVLSAAGGAGTGASSAATVAGGTDDDRIRGGAGSDALDGGSGVDTLRFRSAGDGVRVDLRDGTSTGDGSDSLAGFENVMGSKNADTIHGNDGPNRLAGGGGADRLFAHGGADHVIGGKGNDRLHGHKGRDELFGRGGRDELDGGKGEDRCKGGPDPDSFVHCERIRLD